MQEQKQKQIPVKPRQGALPGEYSNLMKTGFTGEEFIMDFMKLFPGAEGELVSRIITSPGHMKRIIEALQNSMKQYEEKHGEVKQANEPQGQIGFTD